MTPRVLFAASEAHPLIKTGGLGDVAGALPAALIEAGADVRLLLPGYPAVKGGMNSARPLAVLPPLPGGPGATLLAGRMPGSDVPLLVLDCPEHFEREGGPYQGPDGRDWPDNALRFAAFSHAAALLASDASPLPWRPQILHANDWQTGLAPAYLHWHSGRRAPCLMSIHNLAYQGVFPLDQAAALWLPPQSLSMHGVEYYGHLSFLKAGLYYAERISTVSPHYAREIQAEPLGFGLQGLLAERHEHLTGILNGIDDREWNPATDPCLDRRYSARSLGHKALNKLALQRQSGLGIGRDLPLAGVVSRLAHQKGLDLLLDCADDIIDAGCQLVLLGSGDAALEQGFRQLAARHPGRVGFTAGYDESLAHRIEAGADLFLMPSRFEPCGLNQMYSQRYGTVPVVHATGGLADTVTDPADDPAGATGFVFREPSAPALLHAVQRALSAYRDKGLWRALQINGMRRDYSWHSSARGYLELYRTLL